MYHRVMVAVMLIGVLLLPGSVSGQGIVSDRPDYPLLDLIETVPDTANVQESILSYVDWDAVKSVLPPILRSESFADYEGPIAPINRINSEPRYQNLFLYDRLPEIMGFDFFDIQRTLYWGNPPEQATIYNAEFDTDAVIAAHTNRHPDFEHLATYTFAQINGKDAWCPEAGCEVGFEVDVTNRDPSNLLDPSGLGRNPPFFLTDTTLTTAFSDEVMAEIAAVENGDIPPVTENVTYMALAEALTDVDDEELALVQAQFLPSELVAMTVTVTQGETIQLLLSPQNLPDSSEAQLAAIEDSGLFDDYGVLPIYGLAGIADYQHPDYQQASIMLVYASEDTAQAAAEELHTRMAVFSRGWLFRGTTETVLETIDGAELLEPRVYAARDGGYVAVVSVQYPNAQFLNPDTFEDGQPEWPGEFFRAYADGLLRRQFYPIWQIQLCAPISEC